MPRRNLQAPIALFLLACGILLSTTIDDGTAEPQASVVLPTLLESPTFTITSGRNSLLLHGTTVSARHETALLKLVVDQFAGYATRTDFRPGVVLADSWEPTSHRLLYVLAAMESAQAVMQGNSVDIRGVASDARTFAARLRHLRENLLADTLLNSDVVFVHSATPIEELCRDAFSRLVSAPISFEQSSAEIRTASFVTLDRVTNFAQDCQHAIITVTGHTDASGDESWNRQLSLARAQAVANHIAQRGIDPERLLVRGLGSSEPLADNMTVQGRGLNRRIEFELR